MALLRAIGIGLVVLGAQFSAFAGELAVLRNGFTVRCERKEESGGTTRLYTRAGFIDVASAEIVSFEPDDTAEAESVQPAPVAASQAVLPVSSPAPTVNGSAIRSSGNAATANLTRASLDQLVREASNRHGLDPDFVNSVIKAESNFEPRAVSSKGAQGLMQLMPGTAFLLGVTNPFDPQANIEGGTAYLSQLLDQYDNDAVKALAAYNAGPHRVDQYHGVPPYTETRAYVARIVRDYNAKKRAQMKAQSGSASAAKKTRKRTPASERPQEAGIPKAKKPA
jgi:hypothetical protein